jgi:hypothetical protein
MELWNKGSVLENGNMPLKVLRFELVFLPCRVSIFFWRGEGLARKLPCYHLFGSRFGYWE